MKLKRKNTYDVPLRSHWFPNSWKLKRIESLPTHISFEQLFLNKVEAIQEKLKTNRMKLYLQAKIKKSKYIVVCTTSSPWHLAFLILEDQAFQL